MKRNCYILESGWIIEGEVEREDTEIISLKDAYVVRKWSNGRGIGGIAKKEYRNEYTLDEIGEVDIVENKVLFVIPINYEV